jgi:lipopolysaccharide heptosyltransferase II
VRIGFSSAREFAPLFYTHRIPAAGSEAHAVRRNYLVGSLLGFPDHPISFDLPISPVARDRVRALLAARGLRPTQAYVVMGPAARWETKIWPAEQFAELVRLVGDRTGLRVVLIGMESEKGLADRVQELAPCAVVNVAGETTLPELIALVDGAVAAVMHDSGPMHLATALKKPMIALYGPTSPRRTGPFGRADAVARLDLPCSPCYLKRLAQCPHEHRCLRDLGPSLVFDRLANVLACASETSR